MTKIIARRLPDEPVKELTGCFDIIIGEGQRQIAISVDPEGAIDVRALEGRLIVRPYSSNAIKLEPDPHG